MKLADMAKRPDFRIGPLLISPSRRLAEGPDGSATMEPIVLQVLLLLADGRGSVVTRDELFDKVWGGAMVGDDSLNRAVAAVRRVANETAPGLLTIETIPRTGYRLTCDLLSDMESGHVEQAQSGLFSRRALVGGSALIVAAGAMGVWWLRGERADPRVADLIERGHQVLRESLPRNEQRAVDLLRRAVDLDPGNAQAWGLLSLAYRDQVENGDPQVVTAALQRAESAAKRTLQIDPANGNALTALATLRPEFGNWHTVEGQLRNALAKAPECVAAINYLTLVLQSVGRATESFRLNEKAARIDPFDVTPQYRLAIKSWIFGRIDEADLVLSRSLQIWPNHPTLWNTRLMVLAYSDRQEEGLRYLEQSLQSNPRFARTGALWRMTLEAGQSNNPAARARARDGLKQRAAMSSSAATHAIMSLSSLGLVDDAFEVADGYYRWRGKLSGAAKRAPNELSLNDQSWRRTMALFTPATRAMRLDRRFHDLTAGIGMAEYWRRTKSRPDPFLFA